jgi:hypothetical protein
MEPGGEVYGRCVRVCYGTTKVLQSREASFCPNLAFLASFGDSMS